MVTLAIRYDLRNPEFAGTSMQDRYDAALDQIEWADRMGFAAVTLSEHHGVDDGYLPSLFPFAAAVAARTKTIRIQLGALIAPFHDPLRVAEDAAVVDLLSHGRLGLVIANGYVPAEFAMFGRSLSDRARAVTEMVAVLRAAWTGAPFDYRGRQVIVTPRPSQPNGPPIMLGGSSPAAARRAARIGDGFLPSTADLWEPYRTELRILGKPDPGPAPPGAPMFLHVARNPDAAWKRIAPHALYEMNAYGRWAAESGTVTGYAPIEDAATLRAMGVYKVVTPEVCAAELKSKGPAALLMLHPLMGGLPPELAWESLRLIESEVLPLLKNRE